MSLLCLSLLAAPAIGDEPVTFRSLLDEMTDLHHLARRSTPNYRTIESSSYDRRSVSPADAEGWFANHDWTQFIRTETRDGREEHVLLDAKGPGAVVRIWSANPKGTLRIYIDGAAEPILAEPMRDLLGGTGKKLIPSPIAGVQGEGYNLFLPIPFAKSCKITGDGKSFYYQVNCRLYESGAKVESFDASTLEKNADAIRATADALSKPPSPPADCESIKEQLSIAPGETRTLKAIAGSRSIEQLIAKFAADVDEASLRGTVLRVKFDGERCIEAPLGDFFGAAPGVNAFQSLPFSVSKNGEMISRWPMPFETSAEIEFTNLSDRPITFDLNIRHRPFNWTPQTYHFHAGFRAQANIPTRPRIDWNYLTAKGEGRLVSTSLTIDNPLPIWWGEGDEKIYVDGESFPSWFGTGTEDYFGYAWSSPDLFEHPYHAQARADGPSNYGRSSVNRFHVLDSIPFDRSLRFDMELWHARYTHINQAVTMYWYGAPGAKDAFEPLEAGDLVIHPIPKYVVKNVSGAIEGEAMKSVKSAGKVESGSWVGASGDTHLWWHDAKPGDELQLAFDAPKAGRYRVVGTFIYAPNECIAQLSINGTKAGEPIDFYFPDWDLRGEQELAVTYLNAGENTLNVKITGQNDAADKSYMFAMDYLRLIPIDPSEAK